MTPMPAPAMALIATPARISVATEVPCARRAMPKTSAVTTPAPMKAPIGSR
jgi:hypothetical protein